MTNYILRMSFRITDNSIISFVHKGIIACVHYMLYLHCNVHNRYFYNNIYIHNKYTQCTYILCKQKLLFWMWLIAINRSTALIVHIWHFSKFFKNFFYKPRDIRTLIVTYSNGGSYYFLPGKYEKHHLVWVSFDLWSVLEAQIFENLST